MSDDHNGLAARDAIADLDEMIRLTSVWDTRSGKMAVVMNHFQNKLRKARAVMATANNCNIPPPPDMRK